MSNHAHRRRPGELPGLPPERGGFFRRLLGLDRPRQRMGAAVAGSASSRVEAELMAGFLRSQGIKAIVSADDEGGLSPALQTGQRVRVLVPAEHHDRARDLLSQQN